MTTRSRPTVLIADDDADLIDVLATRCRARGLEVLTAPDGFTALTLAHQYRPQLICLDVSMPSGSGLSACEMLASNDELCNIPRIVLTGSTSEDTIRRCHQMCTYYVSKCADVWSRLEPLMDELIDVAPAGPRVDADQHASTNEEQRGSVAKTSNIEESIDEDQSGPVVDRIFAMLGVDGDFLASPADRDAREAQAAPTRQPAAISGDGTSRRGEPPWVLCVDDDPDFSKALQLRLEVHGVAVIRALDGSAGYRAAFTSPADVILLDYHMPNGRGDYVLRRLKENPVTRDIPVIVLTGMRDRSVERTMLNLGAEEYLIKPVGLDRLLEVLSRFIPVLRTPVAAGAEEMFG